jgi:hypothetical protein
MGLRLMWIERSLDRNDEAALGRRYSWETRQQEGGFRARHYLSRGALPG